MAAMFPSSFEVYKQKELRFRQKLFPNIADVRHITVVDIRRATDRITKLHTSPMTANDIAQLLDIIQQREAIVGRYGDRCTGHQFWIKLLRDVYASLKAHWEHISAERPITIIGSPSLSKANPVGVSTASLNSLRETLHRLDIEQGRSSLDECASKSIQPLLPPNLPTPDMDAQSKEPSSLQATSEEVCILTGLENVRLLGEWLQGIWRDMKKGDLDFATAGILSNCVHELVHRQFGELDLLYNWRESSIVDNHPLIADIGNAAQRYPGLVDPSHASNLALRAPAMTHRRSPTFAAERYKASISEWLISLTQDVWDDSNTEDHLWLNPLRAYVLLYAIRLHLSHLQAQTPTDQTELQGVRAWIVQAKLSLDRIEELRQLPIWGVCDLAAQIMAARFWVDRLCTQLFAYARIAQTFSSSSANATIVRQWLLDRYGSQLYPAGPPTSLSSATASIMAASWKRGGRHHKAIYRRTIVETLVKGGDGLSQVISRFRERDTTWSGINGDCLLLDHLKPEVISETNTTFHLDGSGWDAVLPPVKGATSEYVDSMCEVTDLVTSEDRQHRIPLSNVFDTTFLNAHFSPTAVGSDLQTDLQTSLDQPTVFAFSSGGFVGTRGVMYQVWYPAALPPGASLTLNNSVWLTVAAPTRVQGDEKVTDRER